MALEHKIDFALVFTAHNANPNGDPLDGNRPRTTYSGLGEVSDVSSVKSAIAGLMTVIRCLYSLTIAVLMSSVL